jgi:hypothetical protein
MFSLWLEIWRWGIVKQHIRRGSQEKRMKNKFNCVKSRKICYTIWLKRINLNCRWNNFFVPEVYANRKTHNIKTTEGQSGTKYEYLYSVFIVRSVTPHTLFHDNLHNSTYLLPSPWRHVYLPNVHKKEVHYLHTGSFLCLPSFTLLNSSHTEHKTTTTL